MIGMYRRVHSVAILYSNHSNSIFDTSIVLDIRAATIEGSKPIYKVLVDELYPVGRRVSCTAVYIINYGKLGGLLKSKVTASSKQSTVKREEVVSWSTNAIAKCVCGMDYSRESRIRC